MGLDGSDWTDCDGLTAVSPPVQGSGGKQDMEPFDEAYIPYSTDYFNAIEQARALPSFSATGYNRIQTYYDSTDYFCQRYLGDLTSPIAPRGIPGPSPSDPLYPP